MPASSVVFKRSFMWAFFLWICAWSCIIFFYRVQAPSPLPWWYDLYALGMSGSVFALLVSLVVLAIHLFLRIFQSIIGDS